MTKKMIRLLAFIVMSACALPLLAAQRLAQLKKQNENGSCQDFFPQVRQQKIDAIINKKIFELLSGLQKKSLCVDALSDKNATPSRGKVLLQDIEKEISNSGINFGLSNLAVMVCKAFKQHLNITASVHTSPQVGFLYLQQDLFSKKISAAAMMSIAYHAEKVDNVCLLMNLGVDPCCATIMIAPSELLALRVENLKRCTVLNKKVSDALCAVRSPLMTRAVADADVNLALFLKNFTGIALNTVTPSGQTILGSYCSNEQYHACKGDGLDKKTSQTINKLMRLGCDPLQMSVVSAYDKKTNQLYKYQATAYDYLCSLKHDEQLSESCKSVAHDIAQKIKNNNRQFLMHGMTDEKKYTDISIQQACTH